MPDDYRISELDSVVTITNGDLVELSTVDGSSESGYTSVKATITQLADKILKGIQFATDLDTENKTIIGAINELKVMAGTTAPTAAQGVDGNLYIQYTAGTGGADDVIDGLYIKLDGAWCEISTGGGGSGGHEIIDDSGTALTQRANLQFKGAYSEDNSGDDTTEVNVVRSMTKAQYNQLSSDEKVGIINVTDEEVTATELPISANDSTNTKTYIDGITKSKVMTFSESKTSNYGVVTTNIPVTKCLLGYYFGSYGLIPYKHSSGNWYFNVVNAENGYIVPKVGETDTLTVYYFSFNV